MAPVNAINDTLSSFFTFLFCIYFLQSHGLKVERKSVLVARLSDPVLSLAQFARSARGVCKRTEPITTRPYLR
jgi:hypothetical protein